MSVCHASCACVRGCFGRSGEFYLDSAAQKCHLPISESYTILKFPLITWILWNYLKHRRLAAALIPVVSCDERGFSCEMSSFKVDLTHRIGSIGMLGQPYWIDRSFESLYLSWLCLVLIYGIYSSSKSSHICLAWKAATDFIFLSLVPQIYYILLFTIYLCYIPLTDPLPFAFRIVVIGGELQFTHLGRILDKK